MLVSGSFMLLAAALLFLAPKTIAHIYTPDAAVVAAVLPLFAVSAVFQFFDGMQVTAIGALRGAGDTHSGLLTHLVTYWVVGLPLGIYLCFHVGLGARGLWSGLCLALVCAGFILTARWNRLSHGLILNATNTASEPPCIAS